MNPLREKDCDKLLNFPFLEIFSPEPPKPKPPRVRKKRQFKLPPRFPMITEEQYASWCTHIIKLRMAKCKVDDQPPPLFPEMYLKPRQLDFFAQQLNEFMIYNKELVKRINLIERRGGYVDCHMPKPIVINNNKVRCKKRQKVWNAVADKNQQLYNKILNARSIQPRAQELDALWENTKHKLMLSCSLPFTLFKTLKIDRNIKDPAFDKPPSIYRRRVYLDIRVPGGSKIGTVIIELFTDITPKTCSFFLKLIKGDDNGYAYTGTRIFRIVPGLYCRIGDVVKDNGFGCYAPENYDQSEPMEAENFILNHTVPGVLSMAVNQFNKDVPGQFNIIFKPLPQFDQKHVVFGRIIGGPPLTLERISALGLPLGGTATDCVIHRCGWITRNGTYREGLPNTIKFPPRRRAKKI